MSERAQTVVVGSGPGGAVAACVLAEAGRDVLLVEEGPNLGQGCCRPFSIDEMVQKYRNGGVTAALGPCPVAYVEGFGVGGGSDTAVRAVAEGLKPLLKVPLLITNMPGGGATKGMLHVSMQPADGYTLLAVTTSHLIDAVKPKTRSQLLRDFDPLMRIQWDTTAVFVSGDSKFKTLAELADWGRKNPRQLKFAGTSPGGWSEIQTVAFFKKQGVEVTFVPFDSGAEIKAAILGGHITGACEELAETLPLAKAGKLKALCVIMVKRHPAIPEVPCS